MCTSMFSMCMCEGQRTAGKSQFFLLCGFWDSDFRLPTTKHLYLLSHLVNLNFFLFKELN